MKKNSIWFLAGLSGGHLYPLFSILKAQYPNNNGNVVYHFFIPKNDLIEMIINNQKDIIFNISIFSYPKPKKNLYIVLFLLYSIINFFKILYYGIKEKPEKIYSTGGYFSLPFALYAWIFSIPFCIYHLDVIPGLAGKLIGKYKNVTQYIIHEKTKEYLSHKNNICIVDYPIRYGLIDKKNTIESKEKLNKINQYIIFILGGSQGSEEINKYMIEIIPLLKKKNIYLIHQTGKNQRDYTTKIYEKHKIDSFVFDYKDDLIDYYNAADLIIGRAGAGTIAEIDFFKKSALIIPLQGHATDHQIKNAELYAQKNRLIKIILNKNTFITIINEYIS